MGEDFQINPPDRRNLSSFSESNLLKYREDNLSKNGMGIRNMRPSQTLTIVGAIIILFGLATAYYSALEVCPSQLSVCSARTSSFQLGLLFSFIGAFVILFSVLFWLATREMGDIVPVI